MSNTNEERRAEIFTEAEPVTEAEPITLLDNGAELSDVITHVQDLERRMGAVQHVEVLTPFLPHDWGTWEGKKRGGP
jgi:hypothetical protein